MRIFLSCLAVSLLLFAGSCTKDVTPNAPPSNSSVTILSPTEGQVFAGSTTLVVLGVDENMIIAKAELYIDAGGAPIRTLTSAPWIFQLDLSAYGEGVHALQAKIYDATGTATTSDVRRFTRQTSGQPQSERILLVENFTNTGCLPCKAAEEDYERLLSNQALASRVATVLYHVFWPDPKDPFYLANKPPIQQRVQYDSVLSAPHVRFNGFLRGDNTTNYFRDWQVQMLSELVRPPDVGIELTSEGSGNDITITARLTPYAQTFANDLKFYLLITEDSVYYEGQNGIKNHNYAMRDMLTGGLGEPIALTSGQPVTITKQYTLNPQWVRKQLHILSFVQSHASKLVLQAAKLRID